ncbi:MAG: hypothetical protein WBG70_05705 [Spirulinaceae cyanobacterium]
MNDHHLPDRSEANQEFYQALDQLKNLLEFDNPASKSSQSPPEQEADSIPEKEEEKLNWDEVAADLEDLPE